MRTTLLVAMILPAVGWFGPVGCTEDSSLSVVGTAGARARAEARLIYGTRRFPSEWCETRIAILAVAGEVDPTTTRPSSGSAGVPSPDADPPAPAGPRTAPSPDRPAADAPPAVGRSVTRPFDRPDLPPPAAPSTRVRVYRTRRSIAILTAALRVSLQANPSRARAGESVRVTIRVENASEVGVRDVRVTVQVDAALQYIRHGGRGVRRSGDELNRDGALFFRLDRTIEPGRSAAFDVYFTVRPAP